MNAFYFRLKVHKKQIIKDRQREQYLQTDNKSMLKWNKMTILVLQNKLIIIINKTFTDCLQLPAAGCLG